MQKVVAVGGLYFVFALVDGVFRIINVINLKLNNNVFLF